MYWVGFEPTRTSRPRGYSPVPFRSGVQYITVGAVAGRRRFRPNGGLPTRTLPRNWCTRMVSSHPVRLFRPTLIRLSYSCKTGAPDRSRTCDGAFARRVKSPMPSATRLQTHWRDVTESNRTCALWRRIDPMIDNPFKLVPEGWFRTSDISLTRRALCLLSYKGV